MSKLWICGICQNNEKDVYELLKLATTSGKDVGILFVDGGSTDNTKFTIENFDGICLNRTWTNDHDFQMNEYLRSKYIEHGDWILQVDTSERVHPDFIRKLVDKMIPNFEAQGINTVYQRSKPILFRKFDDQFFLGSPHWGLQGQRHHMVDIAKFDGFEDDKTYFWSLRDDINKWVVNGMKYYYVYGRSNHIWLVYSPANYPGLTPQAQQQLIQSQETLRQQFRAYCRNTLHFRMDTLEDIDAYLSLNELNADMKDFINSEKIIANYYRYLQGEDQKNIYNTQNTWKIKI